MALEPFFFLFSVAVIFIVLMIVSRPDKKINTRPKNSDKK